MPPPSPLGQRIADVLHAAGLEPSRELATALNEIALRIWAECMTPPEPGDDQRGVEAQAIVDQLRGRAQP